jgi:glyoxylase-like metal-dependent hydrolase (beta-lactamase superfamily II)
MGLTMEQITENLYLYRDTCNVYVIRSGHDAVLIDFGSGAVLSELAALGIDRVTDIVMTHHHRDQGQGLPLAIQAGISIWVPHAEQDLFQEVDAHWQARAIYNYYDVRQDRFSLLNSVKIAGTLHDYSTCQFGAHTFTVIPTPGHTVGSISFFAEIDGKRLIFCGDLISGPGKMWSLAATQWTYNGGEGIAVSVPSLLDLKTYKPDMLLPSHGYAMDDPLLAIDLLVTRLALLLEERHHNPRLFLLMQSPYAKITEHLLRNRTSMANSFVLLSKSGKALLIDYGYDFMAGSAAGVDRSSRRPWLYTLPMLKRDYGVTKIDVVVPTHYHDDHVAGLNLLRDVEGTQVWAAENFADILERPSRYDLPCLWYDPIPVDRVLPLARPVRWEEYELVLYEQPGHTFYAVAIAFEVDGKRVLAIGDQYQGNDGSEWNYVYENRFRIDDYRHTAELYRAVNPDLLISGHWEPLWVKPGYFDMLEQRGEALERLHRELLPLDTIDMGAEGAGAKIQPYQVSTYGGECIEFDVEIVNPLPREETAVVTMVAPAGWQVLETDGSVVLKPHEVRSVKFQVIVPPGTKVRRARVAVEVTVGSHRFGQQAEALVTVS